jgi:signal transduction histidine kinase
MLVVVMAVMLIAVVVMLFYNRRWALREKEVWAASKNEITRLAIILKTGRLHIWTYRSATRRFLSILENGDRTREYNPIDFLQFFDRDDFEVMRTIIFAICDGKQESGTLRIRSNPAADGGQRYYETTISVLERDNNGHAKILLGLQRDMTDALMREQEVSQLLMRYHTVFNSALSDMIYYDKDGRLSDINDKACSSFSINDRRKMLVSELRIEDNPLFGTIDYTNPVPMRTTAILKTAELEREGYELHSSIASGKMYYEASITPVVNDGQLEGLYISGRNVTGMVDSVHRQQEVLKQLRVVHNNIQRYIHNINYALRVSDVRLVSYYPDKYTFEISSIVDQTQLTLSQVRCIRLASPRFRKNVSIALNRMDHKVAKPIEETIEIILHDKQNRPIWLMFNMVPVLNKQREVERFFGMCRNMTELVETEQRLAIETKKAQETENLKQSFLTNMSHEIRTPLNTVVSFAERFEAEHDPADEPAYVEEIKKNSNRLLDLVNDILFLSRIDANMIESRRTETDFAQSFGSCCKMGLSNVSPEVKTIIENDYEHLVLIIDLDNVSKIIQRCCLTASCYTSKGTIRVRYEYWHGELILIFEYTGAGVDADMLKGIFNRFGRTSSKTEDRTGLDLPIIQALVKMLGGHLEVQTAKDKGTTARITIPCEAKLVEKKNLAE